MSTKKELKAIELLVRKRDELGRLPKKSDFIIDELHFIKSVLGPMPRALEAAGLKEISPMYLEKQKRRGERRRHRHRKRGNENS